MDRSSANGGFPLPLASEPVRLVSTRHQACGRETRVRLPQSVPAGAVRRVVCEGCAVSYETEAGDTAADRGAAENARRSVWRWASVPVAALLVVLALNALQDGEDQTGPAPEPAAETSGSRAQDRAPRVIDVTAGGGAAAGATEPADGAQFVTESTYSLALPAGWDRVTAQGGATFAAVAPGGEADATLWVEHDPKLDFATFEARSLEQLEQLAGSAEVVNRTSGPTPEATIVRIAADAPAGAPRYEVLLRAAEGGYWYYLATTVQPEAPGSAIDGVEVLQGSLVPEGGAG